MTSDLKVNGFKAAAVRSGIRGKDRLDMGLIVCECSAAAAGVFTTSRVKAAPVLLDIERLASGRARAVLVNSGIANACSGEAGMAAAVAAGRLAADGLGIDQREVLVSSTGVIGEQLDLACFEKGVPELIRSLSADGLTEVSRAIMTTDTVPKTAVRHVEVDGKPVKLAGLAKGAGMIKPDMATMLAFIMTDAAVEPACLRTMLRAGCERSFNRITVDGDTSTNDSAIILANGLAANRPLTGSSEGSAEFGRALNDLLKDLALQIVRDGEGATKLVTVRVTGARSDAEARQAAETVANSNLVKTAFFGEDANWGRIIAALGRSGAEFDQYKVDIAFDDALLVADGLGLGRGAEAAATGVLRNKEFSVNIDLKNGEGLYACYTCDFSLDYVRINADYRS
ncbi:MAG: bifunctional glutamate N-acetyltransferase/amino-acid acetyltransferase ArgJ [Desulfobulbales bacterium]|nr:bifunctional glutamate N-acetyltransferase/amino-acid acetyltransferase ArgJ [Desulfobulbales bacterium]